MRSLTCLALVLMAAGLLCGCGGKSSSSSMNMPPNPTQIAGELTPSDGQFSPVAQVALEQRDAAGVDRIVMMTASDANGNFSFSGVASGTYDLAAFNNGTCVGYASMVVFGVPNGTNLGAIPLATQCLAPEALPPGSAQGSVTSSPGPVDATVWLLWSINSGGSSSLVTVPLPTSQNAVTTSSGQSSFQYSVSTAAFLPTVGAFKSGNVTFTANSGPAYVIDVQAFQPGSSTPDCSPSELRSQPFTIGTTGAVTHVQTLSFTGC